MKRLAIALLVLLVGAAASAWWGRTRLKSPYRGFTESEVFVELPIGTSVAGIATRLAAAGVVPDPWTFRIAARLSGADRRLQAGEYRFVDAASPDDVVARLTRGDVYTHPITFPEGLTIKEMAALYEQGGLGAATDFERAGLDGSLVGDLDPEARTLEGYLFPDTYPLPRRDSAERVVAAMVSRFKAAFDMNLRARGSAAGLSVRDVVTLASLIEKETASADERPLVSAVYRNRLKLGMPLQCDPTVIYALMRAGRWHGNLTRADLQVESPYNTYRHPGLPPGPIASPGRASLEAAVSPADVPYLYFVSRNDGTHAFAATLKDHSRNVREWQVQYFRQRR